LEQRFEKPQQIRTDFLGIRSTMNYSHDQKMNLKAVIALVMGLVFQLAQMVPSAAATTSCAPAPVCACCESADSCACAKCGDSEQLPVPATPADHSGELKMPLPASTEILSTAQPADSPAAPTTSRPMDRPSFIVGFQGVRYSVAFCSFVI
jgi:hypothetical protein